MPPSYRNIKLNNHEFMNNPAAKLLCTSAAMLLLALEPLGADTLLSGPGAGFNTQTSTGTDGYGFKVGSSSLFVTALGIWDSPEPTPNGLDEAHDVSIWTTDGVLLGRVNVPSGTAGALDGPVPLRVPVGSPNSCRGPDLCSGRILPHELGLV